MLVNAGGVETQRAPKDDRPDVKRASRTSPRSELAAAERGHLLSRVGERVRQIRSRRGMSRRVLAKQSDISERYLAEVERGAGNLSLILLQRVAHSLAVSLDTLVADGPDPAAELVQTVEFLRRLPAEDVATARDVLFQHFGYGRPETRHDRIALIGLRGAGKSTLGGRLAAELGVPFFELDRLIEEESGLTLDLVFEFQGQSGFRQLEFTCLHNLLRRERRFVLATGGSLVSEAGTFELLLSRCFTVWLRASPEEHMQRVIAQGDLRPMAGDRNAMANLSRILEERHDLYSRADAQVDTSGLPPEQSLVVLRQVLRAAPPRETVGVGR